MVKKIKTAAEMFAAATENIDWDCDDKKRIKENTKKYADETILNAFLIEAGRKPLAKTSAKARRGDMSLGNLTIGQDVELTLGYDPARNIFEVQDSYKSPIVLSDKDRLDPDCAKGKKKELKAHFIVAKVSDDEVVVSRSEWIERHFRQQCAAVLSHEGMAEYVFHIESIVGNGGYTGSISINDDLLERPVKIKGFLPGSHIALNIERDFEKWLDTDIHVVPLAITNHDLSFSRKNLLRMNGNEFLFALGIQQYPKSRAFGSYADTNTFGDKLADKEFTGVCTGAVRSRKTNGVSGIFIEIPDYNVTGIWKTNNTSMYQPGDIFKVKISRTELAQDRDVEFINDVRLDKGDQSFIGYVPVRFELRPVNTI